MKKIIYFPPTYPDEDFRSIVHRYYLRSAKSFELSKEELLGKIKRGPIIYPENLTRISNDLGLMKDFENEIIENHSYFPMIRPFLTKERQAYILQGMRGNTTRNQLKALSMYSFTSSEGRYCPDCMIEDYDKYRTVYLHRLHQFLFLNHCLLHGKDLISSCNKCEEPLIRKDGREMPYDLYCTYCNQDLTESRNPKKRPTDQALIDDLNTLLKGTTLDIDFLHVKFMIYIGTRNFIHFRGGHIYKKKLMHQFIEFYGEKYLTEFGIFTENLMNDRRTKLFNKDYMGRHIIVYILLMRYLSGSVKSFLSQHECYSIKLPFGFGPWPCLNPICVHYNKNIISKVKRKVNEYVTGRFTCPDCGMIYTRKTRPNEDKNSGYSIDTWGPLFRGKVIELHEMGLNLTQISKQLHSNTTTVHKYLRPHIGHRRKRRYPRGIDDERVLEIGFFQAVVAQDDKKSIYKETILNAINTLGNGATRPQIRKSSHHRYNWLMKREREWMEKHLPPIRKSSKNINRNTLDDEMYSELKKAITSAYQKNPHKRIVGAVILQQVIASKRYLYYRHRSILPRSRELFESNIETADDYVIRTIDHFLERIQKSRYRSPSIITIGRLFPVVKQCSKEVKEWFIDELEKKNR
ncbi:TnsD family Tn7-like transposition protein [Paenibacillus xylanilyticus]|uniref:Transposon Tn7 transposition protein TnsD C-termianl domain-containing protein n=1 Tax=Paenibacillus xylanilyticus TaxID=248903 RepID=A0A7Y6EUE6_9BACL|nr:TnsD family Tn7-like transposition protein [Paenibacillus xylanilyticus]NUU74305.1 hypothetical protein [Paenibacillus xylanilyticus]